MRLAETRSVDGLTATTNMYEKKIVLFRQVRCGPSTISRMNAICIMLYTKFESTHLWHYSFNFNVHIEWHSVVGGGDGFGCGARNVRQERTQPHHGLHVH